MKKKIKKPSPVMETEYRKAWLKLLSENILYKGDKPNAHT